MSFTAASLLSQMLRLPAPQQYWVAYSGGCDSHVLLHALCAIRTRLPAPLQVVHIHHGLQPAADQWVGHCQQVCDTLDVTLSVRHVQAQPRPGESPEAAARRARYRALADLMQANDMILSAHHQNDQAETILLQLLRGAGVNGLAGMPLCTAFTKGYLARPLLGFTRNMLEHYGRQHGLQWVEDPTNAHPEFDRNYLRHHVMPVLNARWPTSCATLARAAGHQAEAASLLNDIAVADWVAVQAANSTAIAIPLLQALPVARQRNVLRYWLRTIRELPLPDTVHLARIIEELLPARADANPVVQWAGAEVHRYQEQLYALPPQPDMPVDWSAKWDLAQPLELPAGAGRLLAARVAGAGLKAAALTHGVEVRFRHGGETVQLPGRDHHHALKKLLQEWAVPPWQRERIPLVYVHGQLAQVVGHCVSAPFAASDDETGLEITLQAADVL